MAALDVIKSEIANLYFGFFGRMATPSEMAGWVGQLQSGQTTLDGIAEFFAVQPGASREYAYFTAPNLQSNISVFLNAVYQNLFHRDVDAAGLATWSGELLSGKSAASVILDVISAAQAAPQSLDGLALARGVALANVSPTDTVKSSIAALYIGLFGRTADPTGLTTWGNALQSNQMTLDGIANVFATVSEAKTAYAYFNAPDLQANATAFLNQLYQNLFHRGADAAGIATWSAELLAGEAAADVVVDVLNAGIGNSGADGAALTANAAQTNVAVHDSEKTSVTDLYIGLLGRAADPAALNDWVGKLDAGQVSLDDIAGSLATQSEAKSEYALLSAPNLQVGVPDFLNALYQNLFGRNADSTGLATWSDELLSGKSIASVIQEVIAAPQGVDLATLTNRVAVALAYTNAVLGAGIAWNQTDDRADAAQILTSVTSDPASVATAEALLAQMVASEADPTTLTAGAASVNEGASVVFTLATRGVAAGTVYSYQLSGVSASDIVGGALTGTAVIDTQGKALIQVDLATDSTIGDTETLTLTAAGKSASVSVIDTSVPTPFSLTSGIDLVSGSAADDTINSTVAGGLGALDNIDGGAGTDTMNVYDTSAISVGAVETVRNVEIVNLTSALGVTADTSGWTGMTNLNVKSYAGGASVIAAGTVAVGATLSAMGSNATSIQGGSAITLVATGSTTGAISIGNVTAASGAVSVSNASTGAVNMGTIAVVGGTSVIVTQSAGNALNTTTTMGGVTVFGGASTTAVTITNAAARTASSTMAGVTDNYVNIIDANATSTSLAGTISSVTLANYTTANIADNALTTLSLTGGSGNVIIGNGNLTTPTNTALSVTANGLTGGSLIDSGVYTALSVTTTGANSVLANISAAGLQTLSVGGTRRLTLTSTAGMGALATVTVSGAAGVTGDFSGVTMTDIDTSASTGTSQITMDASKARFNGGAGADSVTLVNTALTKTISLGEGDDSLNLSALSSVPTVAISGGGGIDKLTMSAALAATASGGAIFASNVTGFEQLVLTGSTNQVINLAALGITGQISTSGGNGLTISNIANGGTMVLTGAGTAYTISNSAFTSGTNDTITLALTDGSSAGVSFAATGITASGVENIVITVADTQATPTGAFNDAVTLLGNSAKTVTISGNAGLTLTQIDTQLTSLDASGLALGGLNFTSGALAAAATIAGSATGTNTVDFSAATAAVTYQGGAGADAITGTNGRNNIVALGGGTNSYTGGSGNQTVTAGAGADTVVLGNGANNVSLGNGSNSFTAGSGSNTYVGGSGVDVVSLGGGSNIVTLGAGANIFNLTAVNTNLNTYTTILDPTAGDTVTFLDQGTETFNATKMTLANTAVFQDYADAVVQAGGNASVNGAFGWFQYGGDTYLVESRHDGSGVSASFSNGVDAVVKLSGLVDLSTAGFSHTSSLTLA